MKVTIIFALTFLILCCIPLAWSSDGNEPSDSSEDIMDLFLGATFTNLSPGLLGITLGGWKEENGNRLDVYILDLKNISNYDILSSFAPVDSKGVMLRSEALRRYYFQDYNDLENLYSYPFPYLLGGLLCGIWKEYKYWGGAIGITAGVGISWMGFSLEGAYSVYTSRNSGNWHTLRGSSCFTLSFVFYHEG